MKRPDHLCLGEVCVWGGGGGERELEIPIYILFSTSCHEFNNLQFA